MSVRLPEHLDLVATAPEGIQKLRGLILELAVRGKLVSQHPNDEPASELLKRIALERARLEAEGVCKKSKVMPPVGEDEQHFSLPDGWAWIRLGQVGDWGAGATPLRSNPRYYGLEETVGLARRHLDRNRAGSGLSYHHHTFLRTRSRP